MEESQVMLNSSIEERKAPSFFQKHKFTLISVAVLVLALIPLILLTQSHKKAAPSSEAMQQTPSPTSSVAPLTQQNVQPTLDATDQQIQQALDESQTEINAVNQINTSADSTTGL